MTYYYAASGRQGPNEQALIVEVWTTPNVDAINWDTDTVTIDVSVKTHQNKYSGDRQTFHRTGNWGGASDYYMPASANATVQLANQQFKVSTQYGNPVKVNYGGYISGHYSFGTGLAVNVEVTINPRPWPGSKPTLSADTFDMGTTVTINTNPLNGNFRHEAHWQFGAAGGLIAGDVASSTNWTVPTELLAPQIPTAVQGTGTIILHTFNNGQLIGTEYKNFTARLPTSVVPSVGNVVVNEANNSISSVVGTYVKLLSVLRGQLTGCSGIYGSSITKHELVINNVAYDVTNAGSANSIIYTMGSTLTVSGNVSITGRVTDSRGRVAQKVTTITVMDYALPNTSGFYIQRCTSTGVQDTLGTYVKIKSVGSASSLVNTTERNAISYTIDYRQVKTTTWTNLKPFTTISGLSLNVSEVLGSGNFSAINAYEFRLTINDKFYGVTTVYTVPTSEVTLSLNKTGVGIGKVWERGAVDAKGKIYASEGFYLTGQELGSGVNLNQIYIPGDYIQVSSTNAGNGSNYPVPSAGYLEVIGRGIATGSSADWTLQRYTDFNTRMTYVRRWFGNAWSVWSNVSGPDTGWRNLTLANGWENYPSPTWGSAQYRINNNLVSFRGVIRATVNQYNTIAVMPTTARPTTSMIYMAYTENGFARVDVSTFDGGITPLFYGPNGNGANFLSLSSLQYYIN